MSSNPKCYFNYKTLTAKGEKYHKEQYCYNYFMEMVRNKKPNKTNFKYL